MSRGVIISGWHKVYEIKCCFGRLGNVYLGYDLLAENLVVLKLNIAKYNLKWEYKMLSIYSDLDFIPNFLTWERLNLKYCKISSLVIEYKRGINLRQLLIRKVVLTRKEIVELVSKVAEILLKIHEKGYIYGDLKLEHLIYNAKTQKLSLIDFGSCTRKGGIVQSFTPVYDRKSWNMGSRLADEKYDIFSFSILLKQLQRNDDFFTKIIFNGLTQKYNSMTEIIIDLQNLNI